jgi:tripartite-type tricarboxylate transporter receptor subunit TctC
VKAGTLKILALSSAKRSPAAPDVPTVAQVTGNKDYDFTLWAGIFAPQGTPQAVIDRLNKAINKVIDDSDVKARLEAAGAVVAPMAVDQFKDFVQEESAKYLRVIKQTGGDAAIITKRSRLIRNSAPIALNRRFCGHFRLT